MTVADKAAGINKPFRRNLLSGLFGLAAASAFVAMVLSRQDSLDPMLLMLSIYVFPIPVAIGIAAGLVAPRKAIVWSPFWACIITALAMALFSGLVSSNGIGFPAWRIAFIVLGLVLAGLGGFVGEIANKRMFVMQTAALIVLACLAMTLLVCWSAARRVLLFEKEGLPRVVAVLNRDYIETPANQAWRFRRDPEMDEYILRTRLHGKSLKVVTSTKETRILGVEYELDGGGQNIKNWDEAKKYLMQRGFREKLLTSLAKQNGARDLWCASLEGTRLTLSTTGDVKLEAFQEPSEQLPKRY
ncbi:hypothetical protein LLG46_12365 [bacterium]|nr:hypothetical protein [bacterium]